MKILIIILLLLPTSHLAAQVTISGTVKDEYQNPLTGANIYLKGTYSGVTSDTSGHFSFTTTRRDTVVMVVAFIGYETIEKTIIPDKKNITLEFSMAEVSNELQQVVISAGTFEAGDKKRAVMLSSLDIVTTANAEGDIYGALNMLPGAQTEGETGKIIVRGGESREMKTFMDGMLVSSPYTSRMPDIPARGRFSPFLFNGVLFSTGGYSAEYGQALSSVLELTSDGLAEESVTSISLLNVGAGLGHTHRFKNSSFTLETDYGNLTPYFAMTKHTLDWEKVPESISGQLRFRAKAGEEGMFKSFLSYSGSRSILNYNNYNTGNTERIALGDKNLYQSNTYSTMLGEKWLLKAGAAVNFTNEDYNINRNDKLEDNLKSAHIRLALQYYLNKDITFKSGIEDFYTENEKTYRNNYMTDVFKLKFADNLLAGFAEADIRLSSKAALRTGARMEYSGYTGKTNIAPRASLAYKISKGQQVSLAFGRFYQHAGNEFLLNSDSLAYENATHFIFNYQYAGSNRLFRIEAYLKEYDHLIKYGNQDNYIYSHLTNDGNGYARGVDIFWRDKQTFRQADYWVSYSYLDTKREYRDFQVKATPVFASKHNLSVVWKQWISKINSQVGATYKYRSGRPYYNPNNEDFLSDKTKPFNDISINVSYLTQLFGNFTIVYFSCENIFGFNNIFGYNYEAEPDASGIFRSHPIQPFAKRTFIAAIFISIK